MAWGTRTIGRGGIARAQAEACRAERIAARGGFVACTIEAESVQALKDAGIVRDGAETEANGTLILTMVRDACDALLAEQLPKEGNGAPLLRLLRRDPAAWEAAHARVAKARRRAAAPITPKAELVALARAAVAERDRLAGRGWGRPICPVPSHAPAMLGDCVRLGHVH